MSDNKLDELLKAYGDANANFFKPSTEGLFKKGRKIYIAKQAIIDYVEGEKKEYYDKGMGKANELWVEATK